MGHWAYLKIGDFFEYGYKYELPITMLFIFDKEDLLKKCSFGNKKNMKFRFPDERSLIYCDSEKSMKCKIPFKRNKICKGEDDCEQEWVYITEAGKVRERMNFYGLTLEFCKEIYELLKEPDEEFWEGYLEIAEDVRGKKYPQFQYHDEASFRKIKNDFIDTIIIEDQKLLSKLGIDTTLSDIEIYVNYLRQLIKSKKLNAIADKLAWDGKVPYQVYRVASLIPIEEDWDSNYRYIGEIFYLRLLVEACPVDIPIILDITDIWMQDPTSLIGTMHDYLTEIAINKLTLYNKIFGFLVNKRPEFKIHIQQRLERLNEETLIIKVIKPLLHKMGFQEVRIQSHGPGEFGKDIYPFKFITPFGNVEYYSAQVKSTKIHGNVRKKEGNITEIIRQAEKAFNTRFIDLEDNEEKKIDKLLIISNKKITSEAQREIQEELRGERKIIFIDLEKLTNLVIKYGLAEYILFSKV
ncbi:MAG TPA: hypothetical protein ENI52_06440 [Thermoplasmata archaeon]|nr:hypothetical protein [Thermoplasmata archaeon]